MAVKIEKYIVNPVTLIAELHEESGRPWWKIAVEAVTGLIIFILYIWITVSVLHRDLP